jgi:uncharacterized protein (TIGR03067 family)
MGSAVRRIVLAVVLLVSAFASGAPAPFPSSEQRRSAAELKKLQGTWVQVSATEDGKTLEYPEEFRAVLQVTGNCFVFGLGSAVEGIPSTATLGATTTPKTIDARNPNRPSEVSRFIYKLEGDSLTLACFDRRKNAPRPSSFTAQGVTVYTFKRQ